MRHGLAWSVVANVYTRELHEHWPKSAALLYQAPTNTRHTDLLGPHPDSSAIRKRNARTVIVVAGAVTAAHDPPTRAADASRLSARCHQL